MDHVHINAGARGFERLVRDDQDRRDLLERLWRALGETLLAWCLMDTHVHVVVEDAPRVRAQFAAALDAYVRAFNLRHGERGALLRGPPHATAIPGPFELARAIHYVHANPVSAGRVERAIDWAWSSAQAYAGLVREGADAAARARRAVDRRALRLLEATLPLESAAQRTLPEHPPRVLLLAAAHVHSVDPGVLHLGSRAPAATAARALFVRLGLLEGYEHRQLAPILGVSRQRITQHASALVDDLDVRRARTLLREGLVAPLPASLPGRQLYGLLELEPPPDLPPRQGCCTPRRRSPFPSPSPAPAPVKSATAADTCVSFPAPG